MDLSFSGAGFMGCYYFGVVDCWNKYIPTGRVNRVAGASAGSLIAAYYLMELPLKNCLGEIIALTEDVRSRPLGVFDRSNQIVDVLPRVLDKLFPEDAHKRVSGRLHIVMTRLKDMKKVIVSEFETRKDLIDALNCSCFIPVWSGSRVSTYKGVKHIDGGFSDNLPIFDEHTIRICCFSGDTDISPYDKSRKDLLSGTILNTPLYFTFANFKRGRRALFPPPAAYILSLLELGFQDTKRFILDNDLIQCDACWHKTDKSEQLINAQISPCISPALSRCGSRRNLAAGAGADKQQEPAEDETVVNGGGFLRPSSALGLGDTLRSSFNKLLALKLRTHSESLGEEEPEAVDANNNCVTAPNKMMQQQQPTIVIQVEDDLEVVHNDNDSATSYSSDEGNSSGSGSGSSSSSASGATGRRPSPSTPPNGQKLFQARRNTLQSLELNNGGGLLVVRDRFTLAPNPLPSCPPSPNLNRRCGECARLRQEARLDNLEEEIKKEAEKFKPIEDYEQRRGSIKSKLSSPIRWIRQFGSRNSYKFGDASTLEEQKREIPAL